MSVTALIAEDEGAQRRALARLLSNAWPELTIVAQCADGTSAAAALESQRPTVAFLDIRMAGKTGLEVAQQAHPKTQIVFTTAYEQHAVHAFELGAADYILKPVTAERLEAAVKRVRSRLQQLQQEVGVPTEEPRDAVPAVHAQRLTWITATVGNAIKVISVRKVLFFQATDSCTRVVDEDREEAIIRTPLCDILPRLDPDAFWQVHRSAIVQVSAIKTVRRNELGKLELTVHGSDQIIPVSQSFHHRFRGM
jgi:DNA-binding LytR/AlgR family response regulator